MLWKMVYSADLCLGEGLKHTETWSHDGSISYHVWRSPHYGMPNTLHKVEQESSFYLHGCVSREGEDIVGARDRLNLEEWSSLWRPFSGDTCQSLMAYRRDLAGHLLRDRAQTWGLQPGWDSNSRTSDKARTPEVCGFRGPNLGGTNLPCQKGRSYCGWICVREGSSKNPDVKLRFTRK